MTPEKTLQGLGGWLMLVGINVVASSANLLLNLVMALWSSSLDVSRFSTLQMGELLANAVLLVLWVQAAFAFFRKKAIFPGRYVLVLLLTFLLAAVNTAIQDKWFSYGPLSGGVEFMRLLARLPIVVGLVLYVLRSKRVSATFVR